MNLLKIDYHANKNWINEIKSKEFDIKSNFKDIENHLMKSNEDLEIIDAIEMMNDNFAQGDFTVFLSHSHDDIDAVKKIATLLEEKGETVFIDSIYWNHFETLLKKIDNKYSIDHESGLYDYGKRNITTAIVHSLLSISLQKVINKCHSFIFLISESIDKVNVTNNKSTTSPWIYLELSTISMLNERRVDKGIRSNSSFDKEVWFNYNIETVLKRFVEINEKIELLAEVNKGRYE